ncbi:MAG: DUF1036 domain-containing protein [Pseudomonadota bacterium]
MAQVRLFTSFAWLFLGVFFAGDAFAQQRDTGWTVCNETSFIIETATAHFEGTGTVVNGWTRIRPGACEVVEEGPLDPGVHYLYGRSSSAHRGGLKVWSGEYPLCVDPAGSFSVENIPNCTSMGLVTERFQPVLIESGTRWRSVYNETEDFGLEEAEAAGVQRLLYDAGIFTGRIDGNLGPRTRRAIGDFLVSNGLDADTSNADLVDILEQAALERARNVGLTFCNRTEHRLWSAMARRRGEGWESRGWWLLEAGGCARVIDEPLLQAEHFAYAEMEMEDGSFRTITRGQDPFCVSRAKFAITGRTECEAAAFRTGRFVATPAPTERKLVFEFFERDFGEPFRRDE